MDEEHKNTNTIESLDNQSSGNGPAGQDRNPVEGLQQALAAKAEEVNSLNDKYLRLAAEFDNYKRLNQRDQRDLIRYGNEQLLRELLPVVDNLERAIKASRNGGISDALIQGVDLTLKQLTGALTKFNVIPVETAGQPFDPSKHQAVASVTSEHVPERHVVDEFQRGYLLHDRILRAAMVSVSTGRPNGAPETDKTIGSA
jgi:molecular chaperone GrpE